MRLTKKIIDEYGYWYESDEYLTDKLGQLEDIEDELGIDLITLFKALKDGIYFVNPINNKILNSHIMFGDLEISNKGLTMLSMEMDILFFFKDYGKTWALKKEVLE